MKLIVGLGNFGSQYDNTFHNVGFMYLDAFSKKHDIKFSKKGCKSNFAEFIFNNEKIFVAKPQTYMNLSGECVLAFVAKYKIKPQDIFVISDDIDLPLGAVRFREKGSAGTHNGLKNILFHIGENFNRIRIGVGRDENFQDLASFVLSKIPNDKVDILLKSFEEGIELLEQKLN